MRELLEAIYRQACQTKDAGVFDDLRRAAKEALKTEKQLGIRYLILLSNLIEEVLPTMDDVNEMRRMYQLHKTVLFDGARDSFHLFLLYMEFDREPDKKFYQPRRNPLEIVVQDLQDLNDGALDLLAISMPPGTGKSTLAKFYICWRGGQRPDKTTLTGSHSNVFVGQAYDDCLRMLDPRGEYKFYDVFPEAKIVDTNAKDHRIDLGSPKTFETLEFTSIGTGNAGVFRASGLLYCDDLIPGLEVALSPERLDKMWNLYTSDLLQRGIGEWVQLHIATRWSVHDIIGRLEEMHHGDPRARFRVIPALNENDESNFDYPYHLGFSTKRYHELRDTMDEATWRALYMNSPIEREGRLYNEEEIQRFFELPDREPDAILAVCDTKDKGTDYACMPVAYVYGQRYYIQDCVFNNGLPEVVDARLVETLLSNKVHMCQFESNSAGGRVASDVQKRVKEKGGRTSITTKYTTANKETKIIVNSKFVKENFLFRDESTYTRSSEYAHMMSALMSYSMVGKNKHDDAPDAMAMLAEYVQGKTMATVEVRQRPF